MLRRLLAPVLLTLSLLAGGCAAPTPEAASPQAGLAPAASAPAVPVTDRASPVPRTAPPMSRPLPPERVDDSGPAAAVALDRSCRTDADCAVKNVGNCCGAMPACVNRNSPTDPAAVQARCARQGIMSVCGFQPVESCSCKAGTCTDNRALVE